MKKFDGLLFCTDLDGTLYDDHKHVSAQNLSAIEYFKAEGGLFTFITGRMPSTAAPICRLIRPNAPYGCVNGAGVYCPQEERYLWQMHLPADVIDLVREVDEHLPDMGIQYNTAEHIYFCKDNPAMVRFRAGTGLPLLDTPYGAIREPVMKVLFAHEDDAQIEALSRLLHRHPKAQRFDFIRSEHWLYEILPKGVNKSTAMTKIAALSGIAQEKTIAIGDYNNDAAMLRAAGLSFAVANASDEAKTAADHITVSNNDHAIAAVIDMLDRGVIV